jgi:hypothetical protein
MLDINDKTCSKYQFKIITLLLYIFPLISPIDIFSISKLLVSLTSNTWHKIKTIMFDFLSHKIHIIFWKKIDVFFYPFLFFYLVMHKHSDVSGHISRNQSVTNLWNLWVTEELWLMKRIEKYWM